MGFQLSLPLQHAFVLCYESDWFLYVMGLHDIFLSRGRILLKLRASDDCVTTDENRCRDTVLFTCFTKLQILLIQKKAYTWKSKSGYK